MLAVLTVLAVIALGPAAAGADDGPDLAIQVAPAQPHAGQPVTLTVAAPAPAPAPKHDDGDDGEDDDKDGHDSTPQWDLDGDGEFDDGSGAVVQTTFATAGEHKVRVRQGDAKASLEIEVGPPAPASAPAQSASARIIKPFPIVRIRGWVLRRGSRVKLLSVRAQRGSVVRVRCHGRGCPVARARAHVRSARRPVRIRAFEKHLRAGVLLQVVVTKPHEIGKYTRFLIRGGAPPERRDSCAGPLSHQPFPCPGR
jgi:hypothetical protein